MTRRLTHLDEAGHARMVDIGGKGVTRRTASASARVRVSEELRKRLLAQDLPKGDVLAVARIAGIMGAKKTSELVPLCHPLPLDAVHVEISLIRRSVLIRTTVSTSARTGVEMEALMAAAVAALAVYDMCKSIDREMVIDQVRLEEKVGGKSGTFVRKQGTRGR